MVKCGHFFVDQLSDSPLMVPCGPKNVGIFGVIL